MWRCTFVMCLAGWIAVFNGGEAEASSWRIGFGYDSTDGDAVLDRSLAKPDAKAPYLPTPLPRECFRPPGISQVGDSAIDGTWTNLENTVLVDNFFDEKIIIHCGAARIEVDLFFEYKDNAADWRIVEHPSAYAYRLVMMGLYKLRFDEKKLNATADAASDNVMHIHFGKGAKIAYAIGILGNTYAVRIPFDNQGDQKTFEGAVTQNGWKILGSTKSDTSPPEYFTAVSLGGFDDRSFFTTYQSALVNAGALFSQSLRISTDRMEKEFDAKYGPDWREKLVRDLKGQSKSK